MASSAMAFQSKEYESGTSLVTSLPSPPMFTSFQRFKYRTMPSTAYGLLLAQPENW